MKQKNHIKGLFRRGLITTIGLVAFVPINSSAQTSDAISQCRAVIENAARLACYDAIEVAQSAPAPSTAPDAVAVSAPAVAAEPEAAPIPVIAKAERAAAPTPAPAPTVAEPAAASTIATAPPPATDDQDAFGSEQVESKRGPKRLESRIVGEFEGWFGNTVFRLENGQVWVQAESGKKRYKGPANPNVVILRKAFGSYRLKMEHTNKTLRVKRIE